MHVSLAWWVGFNLGVMVLLGVDLLVLHRSGRAMPFRQALGLSVFWVLLAGVFGAAIGLGWVAEYPAGERSEPTLQFFTAYVLEESLSLDNVFVWVLLFRHFHVSVAHQRTVLSWGMLVAMLMRGVLILGGVALVHKFEWVFYIFGSYLLWAAWRMWRQPETPAAPGRNHAWEWLRRWIPSTEDNPAGKVFVWRGGRLLATSLFGILLMLEMSDVTFAFDSVPAVLAVTRDPFIAYTSNIFAVLGLRALYFLLEQVIDRCWLLHYGLALLLGFIGLKMLLAKIYEPSIVQSLGVIVVILAGSILGSWLIKPRKKTSH